MSVSTEDRRSKKDTKPVPTTATASTEPPAAKRLPPLTSREVENIARATRPRPLVILAANDKGGTGKTVLALNVAASLALRGREAMRVLLLDQSLNTDLLDRLGAVDAAQDVVGLLERPFRPKHLAEVAYPVRGVPGLDAAHLVGARSRDGTGWTYPFPSPRSLVDAALGNYQAIVVDAMAASPTKDSIPLGGRQVRLWLQEADVCYLACDPASVRDPRTAKFAQRARAGEGYGGADRLVCVVNKWNDYPRTGEAVSGSARTLGCDEPRTNAEGFLKVPYHPALQVPSEGGAPVPALADPAFGAAVSAIVDDALLAALER